MGLSPRLGIALNAILAAFSTLHLCAATISYSGTLSSDDQVQTYTYTLAQNADVTLHTDSYSSGGFVPVLSLFDSAGMALASDGGDATCHAGMMADSTTGLCNDAYIIKSLTAGTYTVALSEFFNVPVGPNLSDGFLMQGQGDFTGATCGATGAFYETDVAPCVQRTGNFSFSITTTPEPSTFWLGAVPLLIIGALKRRNRKVQFNEELSQECL